MARDVNHYKEREVCVNMSAQDLSRLKEEMAAMETSLQELERHQIALFKEVSGLIAGFDRISVQFESMISAHSEVVLGVGGLNAAQEKRLLEALNADLITLGPDLPTREQIRTVIEIMQRISDDNQGYVPKEALINRAGELKIQGARLEDILDRLVKAGALMEPEKGVLKLT